LLSYHLSMDLGNLIIKYRRNYGFVWFLLCDRNIFKMKNLPGNRLSVRAFVLSVSGRSYATGCRRQRSPYMAWWGMNVHILGWVVFGTCFHFVTEGLQLSKTAVFFTSTSVSKAGRALVRLCHRPRQSLVRVRLKPTVMKLQGV